MSIQEIYKPIADQMRAVDQEICKSLYSDVVMIRQIADYIINSGGKRIRPAMVLFSANACGYQGQHHYALAAIIEFIHTATLLHDDVVDESDLRRGNKTANALFGNAASVLVGDFLYSRSFQMMVEVGIMRIMQVIANATNTIAEGEVLQLLNIRNADVNVEDYMKVIHYKTAKLFETAAQVGAIISQASETQEQALLNYGRHLGLAFQIVDDVLDYSSQEVETGKHLGDDLAEGKPTLPLIFAMQKGNSEQTKFIQHAIEQGGREDFKAVLDIIKATDALEISYQYALAQSQQAKLGLELLPSSVFKDSLLKLADFSVLRKY